MKNVILGILYMSLVLIIQDYQEPDINRNWKYKSAGQNPWSDKN